MKNIQDILIHVVIHIAMNLHEECLLKYLTNPLDLLKSLEALKSANNLLEKKEYENKIICKNAAVRYVGT